MKNQTLAISILSITAALLFTACLLVGPTQPQARASFSVKDRDYIVATAPLNRGGDALFITDVRSGQLAVFVYDINARSLQLRRVGPVADLFK